MPSRPDTSPSLHATQVAFFAALAGGAAERSVDDPGLLAVIDGTDILNAAARLDIYAQMYWMRIADALREDYPRLAALLGNERFQALARGYLRHAPSRHPSLAHVGAGLAEFLTSQSDVPIFAVDLARLEWARARVFTAADAPVLALADLRRVDPADWSALRLRTIPALRLLDLRWPADEIWAAEGEPATHTWQQTPTCLRVWRDGDRVYQTRIEPMERAALGLLAAGTTFGEVCAAIAAHCPIERAAEAAGALLLRWIDDHVIVADPM